MPVLIGILFGRMFMRIAFLRAVLTLLLWAVVWATAEGAGGRLLGHRAGWLAGCLASATLLAWSLWRPARSRAKLWMLDGVYLWLRLCLIGAVALAALALLSDGLTVALAADAWPFVLGGVAAWVAQRWLTGLLVRSRRREASPGAVPGGAVDLRAGGAGGRIGG